MPIQLDTPGAAGPPAIKLGAIGDYVDLAVVDIDEVRSRDAKTGDPLSWDDGTPRMHKRLTLLVVNASRGGIVGPRGEEQPVEDGTLVTLHAEGSRWFAYRDAVAEHGTVNVGDVMRWKWAGEKPAQTRGFNPSKVYECKLRAPRGDDGDLVARCEAAHFENRKRTPVDQPAPAAAGRAPSRPAYDDDEPF